MLAVLLLLLPILMAVVVVVFVERVKRMGAIPKVHPVFAGVALTVDVLIERKQIPESSGQHILRTLINELLEAGWDDPQESLRNYVDMPYVVQAFKDCDVELGE